MLGSIPLQRADEVLDMVGLKNVAGDAPGKFSLGMSQRLGLAAAILGKPKYLILDEPANGLDPEGIKWLRDFLKGYANDGNAVFVSSHLLSEMSLMADDVIVIGKGKLIANTSMKVLLERNAHSSVFVRGTNMALLEKTLKHAQQAYQKQDGGLSIPGVKSDDIGPILSDARLTILELTNHSASLEDIFFELTADSQEYRAGTKDGKVS